MKRFLSTLTIIILVAVFVLSAVAQDDTVPADLPLLQPGLHLGTTFYGGGDVPEDDALANQVRFAVNQGMSAFTFYVDWSDLEPEPGSYALDNLEASLSWLHGLGIQSLLNITLIDIADLSLPFDMTLEHPQLSARLHRLLDQVVPLLLENGGFLLLLGNEVDGHFNDFADANLDTYVQLIANAREHIHTLSPELAVGVTLTGTETRAQGRIFQALRPVTDVIPFNYYGLSTEWDDWLTMLDEKALRSAIDEYARIFDGETMVIQEIGCPSSEVNASSLEIQAQCYDVLLDALQAYPNVRYVTVFTLYDFDEPDCDLVVDVFALTEQELPQPYFDRWRGYLCTLGLLNPDFSPKPAWHVFLSYLG